MIRVLLAICLLALGEPPCGIVANPSPATVVLFGSTGDLAARKLFPALYHLSTDKELPENFSVIGVGRRDLSSDEFQDIVYNSLQNFSSNTPTDKAWGSFKKHLAYHRADFSQDADYGRLKELLEAGDSKNYIFYLATDSAQFSVILHHLHQSGLISPNDGSRVVLEKPFGQDLESSIALQSYLSQFLDEKQIFRMDHYLGKEGVHKFLKFRFQDGQFEGLLNEKYVNTIQIVLSETIGIGTRANFYEKTGHLRDVVQNHAMQLLALATMERPANSSAEAVHKAKVKVLEAIRPFPEGVVDDSVVRGQYTAGIIQVTPVLGYREEAGVSKSSQVETFVQAKLFIDNPRWKGVPIVICSGKRLPEQLAQITFHLKENHLGLEKITVVIQPDPKIYLTRASSREIYPISVDPSYSREAYENLILAALQGDRSHFVTIEEVIATWHLFTPVLKWWSSPQARPILFYEAGQWGPKEAAEQIAQ